MGKVARRPLGMVGVFKVYSVFLNECFESFHRFVGDRLHGRTHEMDVGRPVLSHVHRRTFGFFLFLFAAVHILFNPLSPAFRMSLLIGGSHCSAANCYISFCAVAWCGDGGSKPVGSDGRVSWK